MTLPHSWAGRSDGQVLVLSNSLGTRQAMWDSILPHLKTRFRVLRYDLPGHSGPSEPFDFGGMVSETIELLDELEVSGAVFAGVSVGGSIGVAVAAQRPDLVRDLTVVNAPVRQASEQFWFDRADAVERDGLAELAESLWGRWFPHRTPEAEAVVADFAALHAGGYAAACRALAVLDIGSDMQHVEARTLIVSTRDDGSVPHENADELAGAIRGATLWQVEHGGHLLPVRRPELVAALIRAFTASGDRPSERKTQS